MILNKFHLAFMTLMFINLHEAYSSLKEECQITIDEKNKTVTLVQTPLTLKSLCEEDRDTLTSIWSDPKIMSTIGNGTPKTSDRINSELNSYKECWNNFFKNKTIFYNMLFVIHLEENKESSKIGYVNIFTPLIPGTWNMNQEGRLEGAMIIKSEYQNKGHGKKACQMIGEYISYLKKNKFMIEGQEIASLEATCKLDNEPSLAILRRFFSDEPSSQEETQYGSARYLFKESFASLTTKNQI